MKKVTKTVYVADDGSEHATKEAALRADARHNLTVLIDDLDVYFPSAFSTADLAGEILKKREAFVAALVGEGSE